MRLCCLTQVIESKHKALEDTPCRNYSSIIICTSAGIIKNWNLFIKRNEEPVKALATWFSGCNISHVENMMFDIMKNDLYGEEWRKFKMYWLDRNKKVPISSQLIGLCSKFKITLPYKTYFESYHWDDDLAKTFWEKVNLNCYTSEILVERFSKKSSKSGKEWKTEGNPDSYDMDKILEALGEVSLASEEKKPKTKKKKSKKNKKSPDMQQNSMETKPELSNPPKDSTSNDTKEEIAEASNTFNHESFEKDQASSKEEFDSVQGYIDSIEQENRCLKMSQQFYDSMEKENQKLKKAYENMKKGFEALIDSRLCKVCMDEEACVVFVPCGHLMSCVNCSPSLKNCGICRRPVKSSVKTYFS